MAGKGAHAMERLRDETECCICAGTFVDPRVLPCLHTFCLKCLQTNVATLNRGQLMACPVCRKKFNIPDSGLVGLQKNFLVERLIDIVRAPTSGTSQSSGIPCEACLEEMDPCLTTSVPPAEFYCSDCQQKLCDECSVHHRKNKMTKLHKVIQLVVDFRVKLKSCVKNCCRVHSSDIFVYCLDCMVDFCPSCSAHVHKLHRSSSRGKIIDEYTELVDVQVGKFTDVESQVQKVKEEIEKKESVFIKKINLLEDLVNERVDKIKEIVDSHAKVLHHDIKSKRQKTLEAIYLEKEQIEKLQSGVIGYHKDFAERTEFLTIDALILTMNSLRAKAQELTQLHQACLKHFDSNHVEVAFRQSDIVDFLGKSNIIGQIEVVETKSPVRSSLSYNQLYESPHLNKEPAFVASYEQDNFQEYDRNPKLTGTIRTGASTVDHTAVRGIALLGNELFIVHEKSDSLYKYVASTFELIEDMLVSELNDPCDIASCKSSQCLYILDRDFDDKPYRIFRLDTEGNIIRQWVTGKSESSLSVTHDSNVLVAYRDKTILKEYSENGRLLRQLVICFEDGVNGFLHAHKLHSGLFLISYSGGHSLYGLSLVDGNGDVLKSVSETKAPGNNLDVPCFFIVDGDGCVLLVDKNNRRVLLYSADLERCVELVTRHKGLYYPFSVCLDEQSGELFVADNWFDFREKEFINGRVLVFQVNDICN